LQLYVFFCSPCPRDIDQVLQVQGTAGVMSCVTAATLFIHLTVVTIWPMVSRRLNGVSAAHDGGENTKLKVQVSLFLMALFASDTFQSFCGMMQIRSFALWTATTKQNSYGLHRLGCQGWCGNAFCRMPVARYVFSCLQNRLF
jgi:hypothetical protein